MWRFLVHMLATIGLLAIGALVALVWLVSALAPYFRDEPLPERFVLVVEVPDDLPEARPGDPLWLLEDLVRRPTVGEVVLAIHRAAADAQVGALVMDLSEAGLGYARLQELRGAVARFRAAGKPAIAFADSYAEGGDGRSYYLASAFDEVWVQPAGLVGFAGIALEAPFFRDALDSLGIRPEFSTRHEFKGAVTALTDRDFPAPVAENLRAVVDSLYEETVAGIAEARRLPPARVRELVDGAPYTADAAEQLGLVDRVGYRDQIEATLADKGSFVSLTRYLGAAPEPPADSTPVALVEVAGPIVRGSDGPLGADMAAADAVAEALKAARLDLDVRAVLLRVASPGGSYIGSDTIWREVARLREAGKPVVVSMGDVAASGGYFVALPASRIVAQPATLTGSIGIAAGKIVVEEFLASIGVTTDRIARGANAGMLSPLHPFTEAQRERFDAWLDYAYRDFTDRVARGRGLAPTQIDQVARGRVFTGRQARAVGLVDELGGFPEALAAIRRILGLPDDAALALVRLPPRELPIEDLFRLLTEGGIAAALGRKAPFDHIGDEMRRIRAIFADRRVAAAPLIRP